MIQVFKIGNSLHRYLQGSVYGIASIHAQWCYLGSTFYKLVSYNKVISNKKLKCYDETDNSAFFKNIFFMMFDQKSGILIFNIKHFLFHCTVHLVDINRFLVNDLIMGDTLGICSKSILFLSDKQFEEAKKFLVFEVQCK